LEQFDVIVASIHSRHKMNEDQMTRRITTAMRQPVFKIWGHALGRLIERRPPFDCRVEEILDVIAESRAAVESWIRKGEVLNTLGVKAFQKAVRPI